SNLQQLVDEMIDESTLQPIREIRRDDQLADRLSQELLQLLRAVTLDDGQLRSFIDGLRNSLHLTQGPPGTGKSYLGVVMVRALLIIRKLWQQVNATVGTPPILVLSYKNHAIDEFLCDLIQAEPRLGRGNVDMIRIGGSASMDPRLSSFSERYLGRRDPQVAQLKQTLEWLHDLSNACKALVAQSSSFAGHKADMFDRGQDQSDAAQKKRNRCAYAATEMLMATVIRCNVIQAALEKEDDLQLCWDLDFIREDLSDPHGRKTNRKIKPQKVQQEILKLKEGIQHYVDLGFDQYDDPGEILYMFIRGDRPLPMCAYPPFCPDLAYDEEAPLCEKHRCCFDLEDCSWCRQPVVPGRRACADHACGADDCPYRKLVGEDFCKTHACFTCLKLGDKALMAKDAPPRNVCKKHALCTRCLKPALPEKSYCEDHDLRCRAEDDGKPCANKAVSSYIPFCKKHFHNVMRPGRWRVAEVAEAELASGSEDEPPVRPETTTCQGLTKKKKPCKSRAMPGSNFCNAHAPAKDSFQAHASQGPQSFYQPVKAKEPELPEPPEPSEPAAPEEAPAAPEEAEEAEDFASVASSEGRPPQIEEGRYDNQDEVEEAEGLQHLREVFDTADWSDESSVEEAEEVLEEPQEAEVCGLLDPKQWTWEMTLEERWDSCLLLMASHRELLQQVIGKIKRQSWVHRRDLHEAEVRANTKVYENKSVIGGTIVGCISRLEAIRSTRPFAIVVEEASEVLEPLLFACFCPSTVKLEMIGDHLQLQPSIMQKFTFERINNVNISMFERLIRAPDDHRVPSSVLSVQRRMRKDVCDLTREYYAEITSIEDHEQCWSRRIPGSLAHRSHFQGREIPGVQSHVYLWTHAGSQGKAEVGLSKINRQEADMAVWLAYYLVECGVPKKSIVILTPYKGQLMLMRKILLSDQTGTWLLSRDNTEENQIRLSTVDRFQGDEADVVIASLVVDEHSRTPFVKLVNRMIVLLSRARLGMYILGNTGYFENSRPEKHWQRTFEILKEPCLTSDSKAGPDVGLFEAPRVGAELPLVCPQHTESTFRAAKASQLKLGFCKAKCEEPLSCGHGCHLECHWPKQKHNDACQAMVPSPCSRHDADITCKSVFANSANATGRETVQ
ncbi:unnamed protein product, partial [Effrenium voratum]